MPWFPIHPSQYPRLPPGYHPFKHCTQNFYLHPLLNLFFPLRALSTNHPQLVAHYLPPLSLLTSFQYHPCSEQSFCQPTQLHCPLSSFTSTTPSRLFSPPPSSILFQRSHSLPTILSFIVQYLSIFRYLPQVPQPHHQVRHLQHAIFVSSFRFSIRHSRHR